jgi:hypothetical protein
MVKALCKVLAWTVKTIGAIVVGIVACIVIFCCVGCDSNPITVGTFDEGQPLSQQEDNYLSPYHQFEVETMISNFNAMYDEGTIYWLWTDSKASENEVKNRNSEMAASDIIPIFIDVKRDGTLYLMTDLQVAKDIAENVNNLNTNSFSRCMFFIDDLSKELYGKQVSAYDPAKDIFGGQ